MDCGASVGEAEALTGTVEATVCRLARIESVRRPGESPDGSGSRPAGDGERLTELVSNACGGDSLAWTELVDRFAPLVWSVIRGYRLTPHDAADVSQTTWLRLAENLGRLRQPERVAGWLATTAGRECLRLFKRNGWQVPTDASFLSEMPDEDASGLPSVGMLRAEEHAELWQAFSTLPAESQLLLRLLFADPPMSYRQISEVTGMPVGSIGPTRNRILRQLQVRLAGGRDSSA
jgi:RNA polymerase sigma factor (sigma-70 family)